MSLSEIYLLCLLIGLLKFEVTSDVIQKLYTVALPLLFLDYNFHCDISFLVYKTENLWIEFGILLIGLALLYQKMNFRKVITIVLGAMFALSSYDVIFLLLSMEIMIAAISSLQIKDKNNNDLYSVVASAIFVFGIGLLCKIGVTNFDDIRYWFAFENAQDMYAKLILSCFVISFCVYMSWYKFSKNASLESVMTIFCIFIPVCSVEFFRLITNPFFHTNLSDVLSVIAYVMMCYGSIALYRSETLMEWFENYVIYNAGSIFLCCAIKSKVSYSMVFIILSEIFTMSGLFITLLSVRKRLGQPLVYIKDLTALGYRYKSIGIVVCLLMFAIIFPPSIGFIGRLYLHISAAEVNYFSGSAILIFTSILIMISIVKIVTSLWVEDRSAFFGILNPKLIYMVYVTMIISVVALPLAYGAMRLWRS